jgi:hypothetical protein
VKNDFKVFDLVLVAVLAVAVLAGCGGSGGKASTVDACGLITAADAQAVLGGPVKAPENPVSGEGNAVVTSCKYRAEAADLNNITLIVRRLDTPASGKQDFDQFKKDTEPKLNVTPVDVSGIGDAAFWIGGSLNQLAVLKGRDQLLISVNNPQGATEQEASQTLAAKALSRLH